MVVIEVVDVWKSYGGDGDAEALKGVNLEIRAGEAVALFGKSGSGKTTLLNLLSGLDCPSRGRIAIAGRDLMELGETGRTRLRREKLGFVFQFFNLLPTLTVFENCSLSLELAGREDARAVTAMLDAVGLADKGGRYPHELSGGEQQRVAIARALVKQPALVLADEPTGNLDSATGRQILGLLADRCRRSGATLIAVSHSPDTGRYADRTLHMVDGTVVETLPGGDPPP